MENQRTVRIFAYLVGLAMCFSISAMAQSSQNAELVADISSDSSGVRWQPRVEYGHLILTVSAPGGEVYRKEFEAGVAPSFKLTDDKGFNLHDGHYVYELRVVPALSREVKKALKASREKGNTAEVMEELQKSGQLPTKITVQSGSFLIQNGVVFSGAPEEGAEPRSANPSAPELQSKKKGGGTVTILDVVHADDVIIQGSACVGIDCVNGEAFGFDTIRLKENNLRIKFEDTSVGAFPSTDWQLTANDSASGGANKFSIEDVTAARVPFTITGGAPTNSLFVSTTGRVGLRTATPGLDLHISTGDTPAHRLEQTNASGFTAQTWDVAGNEANFFVRDVTGGSRLPFRIRPGAPTSSIDISASGNVGIGTASPSGLLHVNSSSNMDHLLIQSSTSSNFRFQKGTATDFGTMSFNTGATRKYFVSHFNDDTLRITHDAGSVNDLVITSSGNVGIGTITPAGKLDVNGSIFQRGAVLFADYVFEPTFSLESIEDHSAFMWNNKHLPAVGARKVDEQGREVVEIGARMRGLLEELEKAHIYISTLNTKATERDEQLAKLERQNAELAERLARIEAMLSASKGEKK
ncbi:MAG: hypothetical protein AABN34_03450 [Acidobacteriota bacterium]